MKSYLSITVNNDGAAFPLTRAINSTGPLTTDGTEIIKEVVNDIWLEKQALLDFYNEIPNGLDDVAGIVPGVGLPNSQPLSLQYFNYGTPGKIIKLGWNTEAPLNGDPALVSAALGFDIRILILNGQGIDRTLDDYLALDTLCYVGNANNATADSFYHADDAAGTIRNTAGIYLILPDFRGYTDRGLDPSGTIDPDGASRIVGSKQEDALQNITGEFAIKNTNTGGTLVYTPLGAFTISLNTAINAATVTASVVTHLGDRIIFDASTSVGAKTDADETRMKNIAVRFGIYY